MLKLANINAYYADLQALWDVCLEVNEGELVALVGSNGAGKTTTMRVITGLMKPKSGTIEFLGKNMNKVLAHKIVEYGISLVPEGGRVFTKMTVLENLELGAYTPLARKEKDKTMKFVFSIFPRLEERKDPKSRKSKRRGAPDVSHRSGINVKTKAIDVG